MNAKLLKAAVSLTLLAGIIISAPPVQAAGLQGNYGFRKQASATRQGTQTRRRVVRRVVKRNQVQQAAQNVQNVQAAETDSNTGSSQTNTASGSSSGELQLTSSVTASQNMGNITSADSTTDLNIHYTSVWQGYATGRQATYSDAALSKATGNYVEVGDDIAVIQESNVSYYLNYVKSGNKGKTWEGWVPKNAISKTEVKSGNTPTNQPWQGYVNQQVAVYTNASLSTRNGVELLDQGERVTVISESGNVYCIKYPGTSGAQKRWVSKNAISSKNGNFRTSLAHKADMDGDGRVTWKDQKIAASFVGMNQMSLLGQPWEKADMNADGKVDRSDIDIINELAVADDNPKGDVNGDGRINFADHRAILDYVAGKYPENFNKLAADVNRDGNVTVKDASALLELLTKAGFIQGDANGDGKVDFADVTAISKYDVGNRVPNFQKENADVNGDGRINAKDASALLELLAKAGHIQGDANGDGKVDFADVTAISNYTMGNSRSHFVKTNADANGDGQIDVNDVKAVNDKLLSQGYRQGDANGDGQITQADADAILSYANGNNVANFNKVNADANGDGLIDSEDALAVQKKLPKPVIAKGNGDANGDGKVTLKDSSDIADFTRGKSIPNFNKQNADVNGDGKVDGQDANILYARLPKTDIKGDVNGDGQVNNQDVQDIKDCLNGNEGLNFNRQNADYNGDGQVNITDADLIWKVIHPDPQQEEAVAQRTVSAYGNAELTYQIKKGERVDQGDRITILNRQGNSLYVRYPVSNGTKDRWVSANVLTAPSTGAFGWPVPGSYNITATSTYNHSGRRHSSRYGAGHVVDISVPTGTPVYAPADGTVTEKKNKGNTSFGKFIVITHDDGSISLFAHLSNYDMVYQGMRVSKGQLIAYSGNTGNSTGPHLHFELKSASAGDMYTYYCNQGLPLRKV